MAIGKPSKGFWRFITIAILIVLLLIALLVHWQWRRNYEKNPPNAAELKALRSETKSLKKKVHTLEKGNAEEEKKTDEALAEVDRLKEYQVTLLDSIQKLQPKPKPDTKKDERKVASNIVRRKTPNNCNCPPRTAKRGYSPTPEQVRRGEY